MFRLFELAFSLAITILARSLVGSWRVRIHEISEFRHGVRYHK